MNSITDEVAFSATRDEVRPKTRRFFQMLPAGMRGRARLARWMLQPEDSAKPSTVTNRQGQAMHLPNLQESVGFYTWLDGQYEPDTLRFLREVVQPGDTFIDVGANVGALTLPMALYAGRVIAIEASPEIAAILQRNVTANNLSNVEVFECAASVGDKDSIDFYRAPLSHFGMGSSASQFNVEPIRVRALPLDAIISASCPSVIKVDVEGFEANVFRGARWLLTGPNPPRIVFEFSDWAETRAFGRAGVAQEFLMNFGYYIWTLEDFQAVREPMHEPITEGSHTLIGMSARAVVGEAGNRGRFHE